ncbi:MAG: ABC-type transport auxiliary lipoprotein family protein [Litorimonas sp.]
MMSRTLMILVATVSLSACVSILPDPAPAPSVYRLATSAQPVDKAATAEIIRVDRPAATQIFNSSDIVVTHGGQKLSAIAQAKWSEATPVLIQDAMIDALESSPQFIGLIPTSGARTETRVHLVVKNFEANFDNGPESAPLAVVQYRVTYARADDRSLLGTHSVRETVRASSINVSSIVSAIEQANDAAMVDIVAWLEGQKAGNES